MVTMTPDTTAAVQGTGQGAPVALLRPQAPDTTVIPPSEKAGNTRRVALPRLPWGKREKLASAAPAVTSAPEPDSSAPTRGNETPEQCTTSAPASAPISAPIHRSAPTQGNTSAPASAPWGALLRWRAPRQGTPAAAPVHVVAPAPRPAPPRPAPRRTAARQGKTAAPTLSEQWGRLTIDQGPLATAGMKGLAGLIAISLVGVVIAPPVLSAQDILAWARHDSVTSGLGLSNGWSWVAFGALDMAAAVCVLISLYCAIRNWKAGFFALGVWVFAGATAFANHQFGTRPGAPGDAAWFFPTMSVLGPIMLHATLKFVRKVVRAGAGGERPSRPVFAWTDWNPITGSPQDTWGAWKTGGLLGIEKADDAMWAYRVVSLEANWVGRWFVKRLVRKHQVVAMRDRLADANLALAIPGLLPDSAFVALDDQDDALHQGTADTAAAPAAPAALRPAGAPPALTGAGRTGFAAPVAPVAPVRTAPVRPAPAAPVAAVALTDSAAVVSSATEDAGAPPVQGAPQGAEVVNLAESAYVSARGALLAIFEAYASNYRSWSELTASSAEGGVALNKIEKELSIGKRRVSAAFKVAEHVLPWAEAAEAVQLYRERKATEATA